jgi:transcriptional regulator with GAF, ATPase, and Fis domain
MRLRSLLALGQNLGATCKGYLFTAPYKIIFGHLRKRKQPISPAKHKPAQVSAPAQIKRILSLSQQLLQQDSQHAWWEAATQCIFQEGWPNRVAVFARDSLSQPVYPQSSEKWNLATAFPGDPFVADKQWGVCLPLNITYLLYVETVNPFTTDQLTFVQLVGNMLGLRLLSMKLQPEMAASELSGLPVKNRQNLQKDYPEILGESSSLVEVLSMVDKIAASDIPILIQGESGTGKELIARAIHQYSKRSKLPFISENCAAIPETLLESELFGYMRGSFTGAFQDKQGLFEMADHGTLFLDEIGDMSFNMQKKLLRTLQDGEIRAIGGKSIKKVDVRVVAASNKDLKKEMAAGRFREDLYYRLHVVTLYLPPLRNRDKDVLLLFEHFVRKIAGKMNLAPVSISDETKRYILAYPWPGNIRELQNEVQRVMAMLDGTRIETNMLSAEIVAAGEKIWHT